MKEVALGGAKAAGRVALVDDEDFELVASYRWRVWEKQRRNGSHEGPYAITNMRRESGGYATVLMHKLITRLPLTDHINGNGLDNRRSNLRPASIAQNTHNMRPHGRSSRFKGVTWNKQIRRWTASIKVNGKNRYLGCFTCEEDAGRAYEVASLAIFGEYAYAARPVAKGLASGLPASPPPVAGPLEGAALCPSSATASWSSGGACRRRPPATAWTSRARPIGTAGIPAGTRRGACTGTRWRWRRNKRTAPG